MGKRKDKLPYTINPETGGKIYYKTLISKAKVYAEVEKESLHIVFSKPNWCWIGALIGFSVLKDFIPLDCIREKSLIYAIITSTLLNAVLLVLGYNAFKSSVRIRHK